MKIQYLLLIVGVAAVAFIGVGDASAAEETINFYVSPSGDDGADGRSEVNALKTLAKALVVYESSCTFRNARIKLAVGDYGREHLVLRRVPCSLEITAENGYARFNGGGDGTWLTLAAAGSKKIDLIISGLEISNYQSAVSINGDRNLVEGWIGGVKVLKNRFLRIGSFREDQPPATAAVRLVNARGVVVEGNEFEKIRNIRRCGGLHSIYVAHNSSDNRIVGNTFTDGCGETIKVRDSSNNNVVEDNQFINQEGSAIFVDSYCDARSGAECTKAASECPSWNNVFRDNVVEDARIGSNIIIIIVRKISGIQLSACIAPWDGVERIYEVRTVRR